MPNPESDRATRFRPLHMFGLATFAVPFPLFLIFADAPEFFLAHGFTPARTFAFAAALGWGIPLVLSGAVAISNALPIRFGGIGWTLAGILAILAFLPNLNRLAFLPGPVCLVLAFMLGAAVVHTYARHRALREIFTLLAVLGAVYPLWFAWQLDVFARREPPAIDPGLIRADIERPPVIWLMFDEFGVEAILNDDGTIDADHFPHLADLASHSVWVRDANTVAEMTTEAIPAMLTGNYPPEHGQVPPLYLYHPESAMTILHSAGYDVFAQETITRICPPAINHAGGAVASPWGPFLDDIGIVFGHVMFGRMIGEWLPGIHRQTAHFRTKVQDIPTDGRQLQQAVRAGTYRTEAFEKFISQIESPDAEFHYLHLTIPHQEYQFLPSGRLYLDGSDFLLDESFVGTGTDKERSDEFGIRTSKPYPVALARQRYLLQAGFADYLLGRTVARLRELGAYERALIIVTADHGVSFRPGMNDRMVVPRHTVAIDDVDHARDILKVPMFIKLPGQTEARRIDRPAETIDLLPTLLDALGLPSRDVDGVSLIDASAARRAPLKILSDFHQTFVTHDIGPEPSGYLAARSEQHARSENFRPRTPWDDTLLRTDVGQWSGPDHAPDLVADLHYASQFEQVDPASHFVPVYVNARLIAEVEGAVPVAVAVSLNNRIEAIAIPFPDSRGRYWARAMLEEASLRPGPNDVRLWSVSGSQEQPRLSLIQLEHDPGSAVEAVND